MLDKRVRRAKNRPRTFSGTRAPIKLPHKGAPKFGPTKYKIDEKASVTVMMWVEGNVKVNHAFADGDLSDAAIAKVIEDTAKILN